MIEGIVIGPMKEELILWRCLHGGPPQRITCLGNATADAISHCLKNLQEHLEDLPVVYEITGDASRPDMKPGSGQA